MEAREYGDIPWIAENPGLPNQPIVLLAQAKVLDKQSQLMNSPCGDPNKELNHKEENQ